MYIEHQIARNNYFSLAITMHTGYHINLIILIYMMYISIIKSLEIITSHLQLTYTTTLLVYRINLIVLIDVYITYNIHDVYTIYNNTLNVSY